MVALSGAAATAYGRDRDPTALVEAAADAALEDAGLEPGDVDALVVANAAAEAFNDVGNAGAWTATRAGLVGTPTVRVDTGPSSGLAALATARGLASTPGTGPVLALGWEAMTAVPSGEAARILARLMADDERAAGLSLPGLVSMLTSAYLHRHEVPVEALAKVSVKAHALAASNPMAQFDREVTADEVNASRFVAEPLRLLHCAPLTDGAAAAVLDREGPVEVAATGAATDHLGYARRRTPPDRFAATRRAAERALAGTDLGRGDVDVIELHDAFAPLEAVNLEDLGFAEPGRGLDHVPEPGADPLAADPAVNPDGGLKARGHPVGATGLGQVAECFDQLVGRAANPVPGAEVALAHNIGGFGNNVHVALLEATG